MIPSLIVANDMVGIGKVAASISLPILASCQIETRFLPTILLSSHTGGFKDIVKIDVEQEIPNFLKQWQELELTHQAMFVGYCPSIASYQTILDFSSENAIPLLIDPIMGDRGELYTDFTQSHVEQMRKACQQASIIFPNLTEACFLTEEEYIGEDYTSEDINRLARKLAKLGPDHIILTGVSLSKEKIGLAYYNSQTEQITYHTNPYYPQHFFGTGDLLSAIISAAYCYHVDLKPAIDLALDFIDQCLQATMSSQRDPKFGLIYEPYLAQLTQQFHHIVLGDSYEK